MAIFRDVTPLWSGAPACKTFSAPLESLQWRRFQQALSETDADWYYDADVSNGYADDGTFSRSEAVDRGGFGCSGSGSGGG